MSTFRTDRSARPHPTTPPGIRLRQQHPPAQRQRVWRPGTRDGAARRTEASAGSCRSGTRPVTEDPDPPMAANSTDNATRGTEGSFAPSSSWRELVDGCRAVPPTHDDEQRQDRSRDEQQPRSDVRVVRQLEQLRAQLRRSSRCSSVVSSRNTSSSERLGGELAQADAGGCRRSARPDAVAARDAQLVVALGRLTPASCSACWSASALAACTRPFPRPGCELARAAPRRPAGRG